MSSKLQLDVCCLSCCGGAIWWTLTKERQAWCYLQVKLYERFECTTLAKKALYKYSSFPFLSCVLAKRRDSTLRKASFELYSTNVIVFYVQMEDRSIQPLTDLKPNSITLSS